MIAKAGKALSSLGDYLRMAVRDRRAGRQLRLVQDRRAAIDANMIVLFACLRNECDRMPFFAEYYRRLGIGHFILVDNASTDDFMGWASRQPDVSVWRTGASYKAAAFGMLWLNDLLRRHGIGRWCVVVDPDEFLVYPFADTRSLHALTAFLDEERLPCLHTVTLDAYGQAPLPCVRLSSGDDPFAVCPYFDRDGYIQSRGWGGGTWLRGGPRQRVHFATTPHMAPALNKIPLIRWQRHYHYRHSTHDAWPWLLNRAHRGDGTVPTGVLFHFKLVASLYEKADEEMHRNQHFSGGEEYRRYRDTTADTFFVEGLSERYKDPAQLVELGLMSPGRWF
jgi:hypothetical protein